MEDWKLVALTSGLSLVSSVVVAVITAILTARAAQRNDDRRMVQEKRLEMYYKLQGRVESLVYNPEQVYRKNYRNSILWFKPQVGVWASKKVRKRYDEFYNFVNGIFEDYTNFTQEPFPDDMIADYKEEHLPNLEKIEEFRDTLYEAMQEDMGSNR